MVSDKLVVKNRKMLLVTSFLTILLMSINATFIGHTSIGSIAISVYFLINGLFWGNLFFKDQNSLLKLAMGSLLVTIYIALMGWLILIIHNLNIVNTILTFFIVAILPLLVEVRQKHDSYESPKMQKQKSLSTHHFASFLYILMVSLTFCLVYAARADEVNTVWQYLHPLFLPFYCALSLLLFLIILSADGASYKLLFIIVHSILTHSFFAIIFPAGHVGYQARILAVTRSLFDNNVLHGWPPGGVNNLLSQIWYWLRGTNFQSALSIILARAINVDIMWIHLFLVPVLWGTFVPIAAFLITKTIFYSEKTALLSSLAISLFPPSIYYGAISVPNSLGYIFFFFSLFFILKYLTPPQSNNTFLMSIFFVVSFLSHFLTGMMAFSLFLFATALKTHLNRVKTISIFNLAKPRLVLSFLLAISIIPLALIYQRLFIPYKTAFSLYRFHKIPLLELVSLFLFGKYVEFWIFGLIAHLTAPIFGFFGILYCLSSKNEEFKGNKYLCLFLTSSLLIVLADYRILKLFMVRVPFNEERLWVFRDFLTIPFVAILAERILTRLHNSALREQQKIRLVLSSLTQNKNLKTIITSGAIPAIYIASYIFSLLLLPVWLTVSVYYGYPRYGILQITSYELEAAIYIDENSAEKYVVISDIWFRIAGQIVVGLYNPQAYYFRLRDPKGFSLFIEMKNDPKPETLAKALEQTNATIAYFVIQKLRLGEERYNQVIMQATQNALRTYHTIYHKGQEKLRIFIYEK
jgi:hypothetical protein